MIKLTLSAYCEIQITFKNHAFKSGFRIVTVNVSQQNQHGAIEEVITGCVVERLRNTNNNNSVMSTCHTAVIVRLRAYQVLAVATIDGYYKDMHMKEGYTYWGLYKIS